MEERHILVLNRVLFAIIKLFSHHSLHIDIELLSFLSFKFSKVSVPESYILASKWADLGGHIWIEQEVHGSLVLRLNLPRFLTLLESETNTAFDGILLGSNCDELVLAD